MTIDATDIIEHIPPRPLTTEEIADMREHESVTDIHPVYSGMLNPAAVGSKRVHGFIITNKPDWMYRAKLNPETEQWESETVPLSDYPDSSFKEILTAEFFNLKEDLSNQSE